MKSLSIEDHVSTLTYDLSSHSSIGVAKQTIEAEAVACVKGRKYKKS